MPIEVVCNACGQRIRVADAHAGKKAKCPKCKGIVKIPVAVKEQWYVQTPDGQQFGPISRTDLDAWAKEGRVDHECQLLQEGWTQWKWADQIFPEMASDQDGIDLGININTKGTGSSPNPYSSPSAVSGSSIITGGSGVSGGDAYPERMTKALGGTRPWVLFLSILGFIGAGFGFIAGAIQFFMALPGGFGIAPVIALFSLAGPAVGLFAAYLLFKYAQHIAAFLHTRGPTELANAIETQRNCWRLLGVVTIAAMVLIPLIVVVVVVVGFSALGSG